MASVKRVARELIGRMSRLDDLFEAMAADLSDAEDRIDALESRLAEVESTPKPAPRPPAKATPTHK
jgi:hypothetical protein